jgi:signal transduction histidine kinase
MKRFGRATPSRIAHRLRHPRTTVRWRLTLMYGGLFLVSGAILLATTYTLVSKTTVTDARITGPVPPFPVPIRTVRGQSWIQGNPKPIPPYLAKVLRSAAGRRAAQFVGSDQRIHDLHSLEIESIIALAIMAVVSMALGWLVAGWVLSPLRAMADTTREISAASLHRRLAIDGPQDELKHLGDTIDGLLERLQTAFDAQRRFVANASHELRTPLTSARALLEMVLSDPDATLDTFHETCAQVLEEGEQQEQLIEALLALAQGQRGIDRRELFDLAVLTSSVIDRYELEALTRNVTVDAELSPTSLSGDPRLIERLVTNLLENALRHNVAAGRVQLRVRERDGRATLTIANTGPAVPPEQVARLLQPFQRLAPDRTGHRGGLGLGLSIIDAIASSHDATLAVEPQVGGGLLVAVSFPATVKSPDVAPTAPPPPAVSAQNR